MHVVLPVGHDRYTRSSLLTAFIRDEGVVRCGYLYCRNMMSQTKKGKLSYNVLLKMRMRSGTDITIIMQTTSQREQAMTPWPWL